MKSSPATRLIVVLGMHRSGTSALTRGLQVLQVDLGDHLMPSHAIENPTGFWEDLDLYALNVEILSAIGIEWDSLTSITPGAVAMLREKGFFLRAAELLRTKAGTHPRYGFKDPRLAKLLPFWRAVFEYSGLNASYVLSLRHPTSVMRSLQKRNGLEPERCYFLWLEHVLECIKGTRNCARVLVDFDRLIDDPGRELMRVAKALDLTVDRAALDDYSSSFLNASLRHAVHEIQDLTIDRTCPPLVREVYATLQQAASDQVSLQSTGFAKKVASWVREFERLEPVLTLMDTLATAAKTATAEVEERNARIAGAQQAAAEREAGYSAHVTELEKAVGLREAQIATLRRELDDQENISKRAVAEFESAKSIHKTQIANFDQTVMERDAQLSALMKALSEREAEVATLRKELAEQEIIAMRAAAGLEHAKSAHKAQIANSDLAAAARDVQLSALKKSLSERETDIATLRKESTDQEIVAKRAVAEFEHAMAAHKAQIADLDRAVVERQAQLAQLKQALLDREVITTSLRQELADLEGLAGRATSELKHASAAYEARIAKLAKTVEQRELELSEFKRSTMERDVNHRHHVVDLETTVGDRDAKIDSIQQAMALREAGYKHHVLDLERAVFAEQQKRALQVADLERQLNAIRSSIYWKMTAHLRALEQFVAWILKSLRTRKRGAPAPTAAEVRVATATVAEPATPHAPLPVADGVWEWADREIVKTRIRSARAAQRSAFQPARAELIDLGGESPADAARRISLPDPGEAPDVSIIVPVFNHIKLTVECLLSISRYDTGAVTFEVIVADDASTDETATILGRVEHLRLTRGEENLGFLRNCNRALAHVRGRYVLYLNNDVQVRPGWLESLLDTFVQFPLAGAAGPRIVYPSGHLQEAGVAIHPDGKADMVGLNEDPEQPRFSYARRVDYVSGACLMVPTDLVRELGGFSEQYVPCYCEDSDLCLRIQDKGRFIYFNPEATIVHHLSSTTAAIDDSFKQRCVAANLATLARNWAPKISQAAVPRVLAFYLPQFHPFPENSLWWGEGFTEWTNVSKARPNFAGHYQPRLPADLGYYDLRLPEVMEKQAELARRYGIHGFCFYYYWFAGKRLLETPIEQMLELGKPDFPFCLCWANENWTRRWDGLNKDVLMAQAHSPEDDLAAIADLARYFRDARYMRVDGRPLLLIYRVTLFPDFAATAARWRAWCRDNGIGEIYLALVESFELVHAGTPPAVYGCDASVEFPPLEMAETKPPSGAVTNPTFEGKVADYRDLAVRFATRQLPPYTRFMGVAAGWDNTPRSQNQSFCFENTTPGAFQAWLEESIEQTRLQHFGDERLIFVNAWNEWAESAYLEPDRRFGHTYLEAVKNALDAPIYLRKDTFTDQEK